MNHFPVLVHSKCGIWNHIQIASKIPAIQIVHYRALLLSGCYFVCFSKFLYCNAFCMRDPCLVLFFFTDYLHLQCISVAELSVCHIYPSAVQFLAAIHVSEFYLECTELDIL